MTIPLMKKAKVPSKLLKRNLCLPKRRPINAAIVSLIIKMAKAVTTITLGKIRTQINADSKTYVAPFRVTFFIYQPRAVLAKSRRTYKIFCRLLEKDNVQGQGKALLQSLFLK